MKDKTFRAKVKKLGGIIDNGCCVDFPKTLRIKSKQEAIDIIDVMRYGQYIEDGPQYTVSIDIPFDALKAAIKRGGL
jgi:hypothetical protein